VLQWFSRSIKSSRYISAISLPYKEQPLREAALSRKGVQSVITKAVFLVFYSSSWCIWCIKILYCQG
jgi:hypothetical protein